MPALDQYHHIVRNALEKDGWTITHDPLTLKVGEDRVHIDTNGVSKVRHCGNAGVMNQAPTTPTFHAPLVDLGAERVLAAEKGVRKIAVEIKTFGGVSPIADLEAALGQYVLYRMALRQLEPDRELYLAAPQSVVVSRFQGRVLWRAFFTDEAGKVIGFDTDTEEIVQWLP